MSSENVCDAASIKGNKHFSQKPVIPWNIAHSRRQFVLYCPNHESPWAIIRVLNAERRKYCYGINLSQAAFPLRAPTRVVKKSRCSARDKANRRVFFHFYLFVDKHKRRFPALAALSENVSPLYICALRRIQIHKKQTLGCVESRRAVHSVSLSVWGPIWILNFSSSYQKAAASFFIRLCINSPVWQVQRRTRLFSFY